MVLQVVRELRSETISLDDVVMYSVRRTGGRTVLTEIEIDPESIDIYEAWEHGLSLEV
jgi:hypothetical protein